MNFIFDSAVITMYVSILYCLIAAFGAVSGKLQPICQPSNSSHGASPKLPTLPTAFSTLVEVNIVNKNYSALFKEYYDQEADKGRIEQTKDGQTYMDIYDYALDEVLHVNLSSKTCTVTPASHPEKGHFHFSFFGFGAHIESVSELFKFGSQYNETYLGVSSVRGIRCHHWRACISNNHSSYYLDYFFSASDWKTTWVAHNSTVIRATINGTSESFKRMNGSIVPLNKTHNFYHVYDFFDFRPGPPDASSFQLPAGLYCAGLKGLNKTVPLVPGVFSMDFEAIWSRANNSVSNWQEIYDFEKKLTLLKHSNYWNPSGGPVMLIHDFNTGIGYNISSGHLGADVCRPFNLTLTEWDASEDENHHIRMKTTHELFNTPKTNGSSALVYKGTASVRGISADIWVGKGVRKSRRQNRTIEYVMEVYFSKPNWRFLSGTQNNQHQVPVRFDWYSPRGDSEINAFNFDAEAAALTQFDIKPCFTFEQQRLVHFSLAGNYDKYSGSNKFKLDVTKAISAAANVSIIRVNGIRVLEGRKDKKADIDVAFILLDKPNAIGADVVVYSEKGLLEALDALKNSVASGNFKVATMNETLPAYKDSFFVGFAPSPPSPASVTPSGKPSPGKESNKNSGVSKGATAGIAIVMLVVGIAGGLVIAHFIMKRRGSGLFAYQRHE